MVRLESLYEGHRGATIDGQRPELLDRHVGGARIERAPKAVRVAEKELQEALDEALSPPVELPPRAAKMGNRRIRSLRRSFRLGRMQGAFRL